MLSLSQDFVTVVTKVMLETFAVCILTVNVKPKDAFCDFSFILILIKKTFVYSLTSPNQTETMLNS